MTSELHDLRGRRLYLYLMTDGTTCYAGMGDEFTRQRRATAPFRAENYC
jgi:hypothetical protein